MRFSLVALSQCFNGIAAMLQNVNFSKMILSHIGGGGGGLLIDLATSCICVEKMIRCLPA